jgi:hypothetical protein
MNKFPAIALLAMLPFAAPDARADCHWGWYCDRAAGCGFVPYCDSPSDKPPPFQSLRPPDADGKRPAPPPAPGHCARKPLPGYRPINPPPGTTPAGATNAASTPREGHDK